jgi:hypothetical protein
MLPQQLLSPLPGNNNTAILPHLLLLPKVLPGLQLPQNSKQAVPSVRRSESEDPLAVALGVRQSNDVQLCVVAHVDEVLRRHGGEEVLLALVSGRQPVSRAVARGADAVAEVGVGEHGGDLEGRVGLFDGFPEGALGLGFAGGVDVVARRFAGADLLEDRVVPGVLCDCDFFVGDRAQACAAGGRHHEGLDLGFQGGGFEDVEGALDAGRDYFVGNVGEGQDRGEVNDSGHAFDRLVVGIFGDHIRDVDDLELVLAMLLFDVVDEEFGFAGIARCASDLVAGCDQFVDDVVADVFDCISDSFPYPLGGFP